MPHTIVLTSVINIDEGRHQPSKILEGVLLVRNFSNDDVRLNICSSSPMISAKLVQPVVAAHDDVRYSII